MTLFAASNLQIRLGGRVVVNDISFDISPGEFVGLIGPNGAGKSTLLRTASGILPYSGSIMINGRESRDLPAATRALAVAFLPQERDVAWNVSVEALVSLGRSPYLSTFASMRPLDVLAAEAAMERMDVLSLRHRPVTELSGGERARALLARALAQEAPLLLCDEPTAGLDPAHNLALMRVLAGLALEGRSVVASTHDLGLAAANCTRLILIEAGEIVADGKPSNVLTKERMRSVYGVETYIGASEGQMIVQPVGLSKHVPEN